MRNLKSLRAAGLLAALTASLSPLAAQTGDRSELDSLREQIRLLDEKLRALERKLDEKEQAAAAKAAEPLPTLTVGDGRVEIASADGANSLRLRGLVQADARFFLDDANAAQDGFDLRRARLVFEGKFNDLFHYVIQPEFAGTVQILDANINAVLSPGLQIRAGRFKTPVGLEQLQSDPVAFLNERSIATNLTPNRDVGIQVHGDVFGNRLNYAVGAFNGVLDGGNSPSNSSNSEGDFTTVARLFATPFVNDKDSALKGLGFGLAIGTGNYTGSANTLNVYRTDGRQTFFAYRSGATVADGTAATISPQAYFYKGPLGILAEYVSSSAELTNGSNARDITHTAFNVSVGYVLTGEESGYRGVSPKVNFNPSAGTWGAFEVVARLARVDVDDAVFSGGAISLADPAANATEVTGYGLGLNWYLSKAARANFDVFHSKFKFEGARPLAGALSDNETVFVSRLQVAF